MDTAIENFPKKFNPATMRQFKTKFLWHHSKITFDLSFLRFMLNYHILQRLPKVKTTLVLAGMFTCLAADYNANDTSCWFHESNTSCNALSVHLISFHCVLPLCLMTFNCTMSKKFVKPTNLITTVFKSFKSLNECEMRIFT